MSEIENVQMMDIGDLLDEFHSARNNYHDYVMRVDYVDWSPEAEHAAWEEMMKYREEIIRRCS